MNNKKKAYKNNSYKQKQTRPPVDKEYLIVLASEILSRVEMAENAHSNSMEWYDIHCCHTEENLTYWEWISQAEDTLVNAINSL